jgi:hypothetical protein
MLYTYMHSPTGLKCINYKRKVNITYLNENLVSKKLCKENFILRLGGWTKFTLKKTFCVFLLKHLI